MDQQPAFLMQFLKCQDDLKAFISALIRDPHARDDIFQEVALILWQKFAEYDSRRSFGAWARGIAANRIMKRWEQAGRQPLPFPPEAIQSVLDAFERTEARASAQSVALEQCLETLPAKSRRLLALRYEQSMSLGQIALQLGSSLDAVHKALSRIRVRLQECIERRLAATGDILEWPT